MLYKNTKAIENDFEYYYINENQEIMEKNKREKLVLSRVLLVKHSHKSTHPFSNIREEEFFFYF